MRSEWEVISGEKIGKRRGIIFVRGKLGFREIQV